LADDPLEWLRRLAGQDFTSSLEEDAAKGEVAQFAAKLGQQPKEPGYEDRPGTQLSRPQASFEGRKALSPLAQQLADVGFQQEAGQHNVETFGAAREARDVARSRAKYLPAAQAMANLPKTLTLGYGPSFIGLSGRSNEETTAEYQGQVAEAVAQRVREEHPDWTPEQITKEAQGRYASGGQTIGGGLGGTLLEKAAPVGVNVLGMAAPFGLAAKGAGLLLGGTRLAAAAEGGSRLAQAGLGAARGGLAGAAYAGARAPEVGEAGDLYSRIKRAAEEAPAFAAGEGLASLVRMLPIPQAARALTRTAASQQAAERIGTYARDALAGTAQGVGMTAATPEGRKELVEHPGAVIAGALAAALVPEHVLPGKLRGAGVQQRLMDAAQGRLAEMLPPELAAKVPAIRKKLVQEDEAQAIALHGAIVDETLDLTRKQVVASLNGLDHLPSWIGDAVLEAHDARTKAATEGKALDQASKDFEQGVGQVVLAAQHKAALDTAAAAQRAEQATAKALSIFTTPGMQTVLHLPTEVAGVQALRAQAEAAGMTKAVAFLDQYARNLAGNPGMATVDESLTARALSMKQPGADVTAQADAREQMADTVEHAVAPPPKPPPAAARTPGALWTPPELDALESQLQTYFRAGDLLKAVPESDPKAQALAGEHALLKKDLDRAFISKEGRPLDDLIAATPSDSPDWSRNPALRLLGGHLPIVDTGSKTLRRDYVEGRSALPEPSALLPVNDAKVVRKVLGTVGLIARQHGLAGNAEVTDHLQDFAQDALMGASQVFARITQGAPRNEAWQQELVDYATKQAVNDTKSFAGRYARYLDVQIQARKYVASIDEEVKGAKQQIADAQKIPIAADDPLGDVKSVLALASQPGGPLHGTDEGTAAMAASLYLNQIAYDRAPPGQRRGLPGKGPYALARDTFIAANGAAAWRSKTDAERAAIARGLQKDLAPRVAQLHDYMKQLATMQGMGGTMRPLTDEVRATLDEPDADGVVQMHAGVWVDPRKAMDFVRTAVWNTERERRWSFGREQVAKTKPMNWYTYQWEKFLGAKERSVGSSNMAKGMELDSQRHSDRIRLDRKLVDSLADGTLEEGQRAEIGKYLDQYRSDNNGAPFDDSAALAKFKDTIASYPAEVQASMLRRAKAAREILDDVHNGLAEVNPNVGRVRGYLTHMPKAIPAEEGKSLKATLKEQHPDLAEDFEKNDALYERDLEAERGRPKGTSPSTSAVLSRSSEGDWYDLDYERVLRRYVGPTMDYVGRKRFENWFKQEFGGTYKAFDHVAPGDQLHTILNQFRGANVSKDDALKLGGKFYQVDARATGKADSFTLSVIGDPAQKLHLRVAKGEDGKLTWQKAITRKGAPDEHGEEAQYVTEWREVTPQIKQGGYSQIRSSDGTVDARRLDIQQRWLEQVMGRREMGATMKAINVAFKVLNIKQFGILNQKAALNNMVAGTFVAASEFGPRYFALAAKDTADPKIRALLEKQGIIRHSLTDLERLGPGATMAEKIKAGTWTAGEKSQLLMSEADNLLRVHSYMAGYRRAQEFVKQAGVPESSAADLRREGVPEEALAETFARRQGFMGAMRTGAMMDAVNTPGLLNNPIGKLLLQYKRPTILFASSGIKMLDDAVRRGNWSPIVRALAVGAAVAALDDLLKTNMGDKFGPRIADLGKESIGLLTKPLTGVASPADLLPSLDDPYEGGAMNTIGNLRVPLPDPLGAGPALTQLVDWTRLVTSWIKGDDRDQAQQYWEQRNLADKAWETWVPGVQQVREWADAIAPGSFASRVEPSGDPDAPWMVIGENGRVRQKSDREELWRRALLGPVGSRKTIEGLREYDRQQRRDDEKSASRRVAREKWFDALQEVRQTGNAAKLMEAQKQAALYHLDKQDYEREDYPRKALPWARFSGKSQEEIVQAFARRVARIDDFGDKKSTVLEMLNLNVRHPENLSGEAAVTYGNLIRTLTR